jgi:hypothetical protein
MGEYKDDERKDEKFGMKRGMGKEEDYNRGRTSKGKGHPVT